MTAVGSLTVALLALVGTGAQAAVPGTVTEYPTVAGGEPEGMTLGPDGNLWFARGDDGRVGKITTSGAITTYVLPSVGVTNGTGIGLHEITTGPDGNLWFTEQDNPHIQGIGKITTSGTATEYPLPNAGEPYGVAAGADGKVWFTDDETAQVSHIDTNGTNIVDIPIAGHAKQIINGPDNKLWFAEDRTGKIGRIDPTVGASSLVEFQAVAAAEDDLYGLAVGPDGKIWFTGSDTAGDVVGNITLDGGTVTKFPIPDGSAANPDQLEPEGLVAGPDGAIWFAESDRDGVGRVTITGQFTETLLAPPAGASPRPVSPSPGTRFDQRDVHQLAVGADANIWWTEGGVGCDCTIDTGGSIGTLALAQPSPSPSQAAATVGLPKAGAGTGGPLDLRWIGAALALVLAAPPVVIAARRGRRKV